MVEVGEMRDSRAQAVSASSSKPIHLSLWIRCFSSSTSTCLVDSLLPASILTDCIELFSIRAIWRLGCRDKCYACRVSNWNLCFTVQADKRRNTLHLARVRISASLFEILNFKTGNFS